MKPSDEQRDMSRSLEAWEPRPGWKAFGDRLNFLSPENTQLQTGRLTILPPKNPERRQRARD